MLGISAGVHTALTLVTMKQGRRDVGIELTYVVLIAGCYHKIYDKSFDQLVREGAYVIVLSHEDDKWCPWRPVCDAWTRFRKKLQDSRNGALFVQCLDIKTQGFIDRKYHDIQSFMLQQRAFWELLIDDDAREERSAFRSYCREHHLGSSATRIDNSDEMISGYRFDMETAAHFVGLMLCLNVLCASVMKNRSRRRLSPHDFLQGMIDAIPVWSSDQCRELKANFLRSVPDTICLRETIDTSATDVIAEGILSACRLRAKAGSDKRPAGILASIPPENQQVYPCCIKLIWEQGGLCLMEMTFNPRFADITWTHYADHDACREISDYKRRRVDRYARACELVFPDDKNASGWVEIDSSRIAIREGCSKGDIVFLKVHSDAMKERVIQGGVHTTSCQHISGKGAKFHRVESILFKRSAFRSASEIIISQSSFRRNV